MADVFTVCVSISKRAVGTGHAGETAAFIVGVERSTLRLQTIPDAFSIAFSIAVQPSHLLESGLQLGGNILLQTSHGLAKRNGIIAWASVDQISLLRASFSLHSTNGPMRRGGTLARQTCSFLIKPGVACQSVMPFPFLSTPALWQQPTGCGASMTGFDGVPCVLIAI